MHGSVSQVRREREKERDRDKGKGREEKGRGSCVEQNMQEAAQKYSAWRVRVNEEKSGGGETSED